MSSLSIKKLINSRAASRPINEESVHLWKVIDRKRDIIKAQIDIENSTLIGEEIWASETQILPNSFRGTHPKKSFWSIIGNLLKQLLP